MIPEFGLFCLILAFCMSITLAIVPVMGLVNQAVSDLQKMSISAVYGQCFFVALGFLTLVFCFVQDDFSVSYVAHNSNSQLPLIYKVCATWGAHEGSLLLWSFILTLWTLMVAINTKTLPQKFRTVFLSILGGVNAGFLFLLLKTSNPFTRLLPFSPENGADLNPLLQDPGFILHPPLLYLGYVGFALPFAFALTALLLGDLKNNWARWARPWALLAWSFLTLGIALGSWWAYYELGWGGWWFWDPVENASFMPWLMGAALTHALYVCVKRGMFASWSLLLAICVFVLSLMGTFLVRSGVLSSVHAFASSPERGIYILGFLIVVILASLAVYLTQIQKWPHSEKKGLCTKESFILLGNVILTVGTLTVLLGTLYPLGVEVLTHEKISVGPPYFNAVFIPIMFPLLLLMGFAPYFTWGELQKRLLSRKLRSFWPIGIFLMLAAGYVVVKAYPLLAILGVLIGFWILLSTLFSFFSHFKIRHNRVTFSLPWQKWGMILAHAGIGVSVLGISLLTTLETERELKMSPGEIINVGGYDFLFQDIEDTKGSNYEGKKASFIVKSQDKIIAQVFPEKRFFMPRELAISETAIHAGFLRDFYVALGEKLEIESWSVRLYIKPFIRWIWLGGLMIALGAGISGIAALNVNEDYKLHRS